MSQNQLLSLTISHPGFPTRVEKLMRNDLITVLSAFFSPEEITEALLKLDQGQTHKILSYSPEGTLTGGEILISQVKH